MTQNDDTRDKFLAAIAERLTPETIAEAHLFPAIRQGGVESGVAVIAVNNRSLGRDEPEDSRRAVPDSARVPGENAVQEPAEDAVRTPAADSLQSPAETAVESRLTVYSAKYRLTVKGPERGKWEFALQAEADAPLLTVDKVVRGVQQRSGDAEDPVRFSGEEFRALLPLTP